MPIVSDLLVTPSVPTGGKISQMKVQIQNGDWGNLPSNVSEWIKEKVSLCTPDAIHIMDGSDREDQALKKQLVESGVMVALSKYEDCYYTRTDPADVARVESKTFIATENKLETVPPVAQGVKGTLGNWISPADLDKKISTLFPGCMKGRTMYVIPFSMGPVGGPLSKIGIELTDSAYVAVSMRVMTRIGTPVVDVLRTKPYEYVKCLHSVGQPLAPGQKSATWPCNPENTIIAHKPASSEILSFGSGYGGNSLLGKKCFALRIGSALAEKQGWFAEHMLITGIKIPGSNRRKYVCAAFPSACGKTNLAMLQPTVPGYEVTCVGDDIAWLRFDEEGTLRAINPENGFFGVAPGTSMDSNPMAMKSVQRNTLFTNVALTDDGGVWWEGMTKEPPAHLIDWKGQDWTPGCGRPAAHPNSRFCAPAKNCPIIDPDWESPNGVPIEAILFGGRRPEGVPLVVESFDWKHGVFLGAGLKSETTAAAEYKGKAIMHDPFSMRPFFGYNFGNYLKHWLSFYDKPGNRLPRIYMVNWFRKSSKNGGFLWPGFGENIRVLDWIIRRIDNKGQGISSPIGVLPNPSDICLSGLSPIDMDELFSIPIPFWKEEVKELKQYFADQVGASLPNEINQQLSDLENRLK
ncbi:phosphoenolpyruvate carboxykinase [GTP] isoform X2 [Lepeophtheirus salmonis]|uniref:phosphoenolpyruvate carboxykinase [GTP] isoform X2 n=1 Tax=Lepeophtheirus salmonis TaxID=72036 RepID=UPI001AE88B8F|nr:phosphoenolpyruvate carboxykinase [GTP]-like isoform X2 [Lepeophtheirus salmonis]